MQREVIHQVQIGRLALQEGRPEVAASAFGQAEALAPEKQKERLRNARMKAAAQAQELSQLSGLNRKVAERLFVAQEALKNGRYEEALAEAENALALDPQHAGAQAIRSVAQTALASNKEKAAKRRQQRPTQVAESTPPPVAPAPAPVQTVAPEEAAPQTATLRISIQSDMPGLVSVRVHVNGRNVFQGSVGEKGSLVRKGKGGRADASRDVQAGNARVEVWVTPPGRPAEHFPISGNFPGGSARTLSIRISASGQASVNLI
jgi:hypothetical protein